ncbi:MAG: hypothetical protein HDR06_03340 [Lachnospiraceae bacterium]|nr:hypothetical protein [Lachnospiraceae bacterium]
MIKRKKAEKTLEEIGKRWYDFDYKIERTIYCYLCCYHIRERGAARNLRQLDEQLKFETYRQWKQYIGSKYINYSRDKLNEFSRYLNQMIRNKRPFDKALNILSTAVITLICTELFNVFLSTYEELNEKFVWLILCMLLVFLQPVILSNLSILYLIIILKEIFWQIIKK